MTNQANPEVLAQVFEYFKENLKLEVSLNEYYLTVVVSLRNPSNAEEEQIAYEQVDIPPGLQNYEMKSGNYD